MNVHNDTPEMKCSPYVTLTLSQLFSSYNYNLGVCEGDYGSPIWNDLTDSTPATLLAIVSKIKNILLRLYLSLNFYEICLHVPSNFKTNNCSHADINEQTEIQIKQYVYNIYD